MQVHRAYILVALAFAAPIGTAMGLHMMLAWLGLATVNPLARALDAGPSSEFHDLI